LAPARTAAFVPAVDGQLARDIRAFYGSVPRLAKTAIGHFALMRFWAADGQDPAAMLLVTGVPQSIPSARDTVWRVFLGLVVGC